MAYSNMNAVTSSYNNVMNTVDAIPDYGWGKFVKAGVKGVATAFQTSAQRKELKLQIQALESQAQTYALQANFQRETTKRAMNNMFNAYREGEIASIQQGLHDREQLGQQRASVASSGVRMGVGSKAELDTSAQLSAQMNQNAIYESAVAKAVQYNDMASQSIMEEANYRAQAVIARGEAQAVSAVRDSLNSFEQGLIAFQSSLASSFGNGGFAQGAGGMTGNPFSKAGLAWSYNNKQ